MATVDAPAKRGTIQRNAMHQRWAPVALGTLDLEEPTPMVHAVLQRMERQHRARGCGCYLFIDRALAVFVVPEDRPVALEWTRTRFADLVGFYTQRPRRTGPRRPRLGDEPWLAPTVAGVLEDVANHLEDRDP